jgi:hypothetical protein
MDDECEIKYISMENVLLIKKPRNNNNNKNKETINSPKEKEKKIITKTNRWIITEEDLLFKNQWKIVEKIYIEYCEKRENRQCNSFQVPTNKKKEEEENPEEKHNEKKQQLIMSNIKQKWTGYKNQDVIKNKYNSELFVSVENILQLLYECEMTCFYCKEKVMMLYEYVLETRQWTLDRIDNTTGHNRGNLLISCLECNLKRRCRNHEKYAFTKQMVITRAVER